MTTFKMVSGDLRSFCEHEGIPFGSEPGCITIRQGDARCGSVAAIGVITENGGFANRYGYYSLKELSAFIDGMRMGSKGLKSISKIHTPLTPKDL